MELWLPITGYEGYKEVSNLGRVRSLDRMVIDPRGWSYLKKGRIRKLKPSKGGYLRICIYKGEKTCLVHRLVAEYFLQPPRPDQIQINHIDRNRHNNAASNLEWCSPLENYRYSASHGLHNASTNPNKAHKLTLDRVVAIRSDRTLGLTYKTIAAKFGVSPRLISLIARNKLWKPI